MKFTIDDTGTIICSGSMIISEIESVHTELEPLLDVCSHDVILDLSKVEEIDTSGLQLLYSIKQSFESEGVFHISSLSESVRKTLILSGFERFFREVML